VKCLRLFALCKYNVLNVAIDIYVCIQLDDVLAWLTEKVSHTELQEIYNALVDASTKQVLQVQDDWKNECQQAHGALESQWQSQCHSLQTQLHALV
jgi:hypothetical protein